VRRGKAGRRQVRALGPEPPKRFSQRFLFPLRAALGLEGGADRLFREASRPELALDPSPPVARPAGAHRRARGGEIVEQSMALEPVDGRSRRVRRESLPGQGALELGAAPRANREQAQRTLVRRRSG